MAMLRSLLPRTGDFLAFFEDHVALTLEACKTFQRMSEGTTDLPNAAAAMGRIERDADEITHRCIEGIHKTFITPIDRDDIRRLIKGLDDIVDTLNATVVRMLLYEIGQMRSEGKELAGVLVRAASELAAAIRGLRDMKNAVEITGRCIQVHHLENEANTILQAALVRLFKEERDPVLIMKWREIYERLEMAGDRCVDVANIIEGIVVEAT
jgi:uncharacterized protein Yka (UPF0111/DUF47 family)